MFQKTPSSFDMPREQYVEPVDAHDEVETVVGPSVNVEGDFASEGNIIVKGTVSGSVKTSKLLVVESGARIFANVRAGSAIVSGEIKGDVIVADRLEVRETAQIAGDVECDVLVVAAGALLHGRVTMRGINPELTKADRPRGGRGKARYADMDTEEVA